MFIQLIRSTYLSALHDHLYISKGKSNDPFNLLYRRMIYNEHMFHQFDKECKTLEEYLIEEFANKPSAKAPSTKIGRIIESNKDTIASHLLNELERQKGGNTAVLSDTLRQIATIDSMTSINLVFRRIFESQKLDQLSLYSIAFGLISLGEKNTIDLFLKKMRVADEKELEVCLRCLKYMIIKNNSYVTYHGLNNESFATLLSELSVSKNLLLKVRLSDFINKFNNLSN